MPNYISVRQVHERTKLPLTSLYKYIATGALPAVRICGRICIDPVDLGRFLATHQDGRLTRGTRNSHSPVR